MKLRLQSRAGIAFLAGCTLAACSTGRSQAQAIPAATTAVQISAFGGVTGNYTGLELGKNLAITAGADVEFRPFYGLFPAIEVRGTYPVAGQLDRQRNILGGLRIARNANRFHPYGDILYGRGQIDYGNGGYPNADDTFLYTQSISNVISFGGGTDFALNNSFGLKGDFQIQRYDTAVTTSGNLYAKLFTAGVVYKFGFGRGLGRKR